MGCVGEDDGLWADSTCLHTSGRWHAYMETNLPT